MLDIVEQVLAAGENKRALMFSETYPGMRKLDNPYRGLVIKYTQAIVKINFDFTAEVNKQRKIEHKPEDFVAIERPRGEVIKEGKSVVTYDGKYYLNVIVDELLEEDYVFEGKPIPKALLEPFFKPKDFPIGQHLIKPVIISTYNIDRITTFELL